MSTVAQSPRYEDVLKQLSPPFTPVPLIATASPEAYQPELSAKIAALEVHPTLEALLHILNDDLASAHFLVRHMEVRLAVPPASETRLLSHLRQLRNTQASLYHHLASASRTLILIPVSTRLRRHGPPRPTPPHRRRHRKQPLLVLRHHVLRRLCRHVAL